MAYVSFFEQLTSSVSLSVLAIISTGILGLLLIYSIVGRLFSSSKAKNVAGKKAQVEKPAASKKKSTKAKKSTPTANTQSEESENEKIKPIQSKNVKQTAPIVRTENVQNKKQLKTVAADNSTAKASANKKQPAVVNTEIKQKPIVDVEIENDQEDEGQWVTQNTKQVSNRNRNKDKIESAPLNRKTTSEKPAAVAPTTTNENESNNIVNRPEEPIEICQLLPKNESRYTANDNWWKQPLNNQQTFSVDDIVEWPEYEQDEQYVVQIKRIQPNRKLSQDD